MKKNISTEQVTKKKARQLLKEAEQAHKEYARLGFEKAPNGLSLRDGYWFWKGYCLSDLHDGLKGGTKQKCEHRVMIRFGDPQTEVWGYKCELCGKSS